MQSNKLPNFFIVGAPRAGTTALYHYLNQHPDVFLPRIKEPHYFGSDLEFAVPRMSFEEYRGFYQTVTDEKAVGDGSVMYLMSQAAAKEIKELVPEAKIIIMLRHPVDLLISLHQKMLLTGNETIEDFEEALAAEKVRKKGERIPALAKRKSLLFYSDVVRFGPQVERYLNVFGKDNIHVIFYDDFKMNTEKAYKEVLAFLNFTSSYQPPDFEVVNATRNARFRFIRDLRSFIQLNSSPQFKRIVRLIIPSHWNYKIHDIINLMSISNKPKKNTKYALRKQLQSRFMEDITKLSKVLNKDLTAWIEK